MCTCPPICPRCAAEARAALMDGLPQPDFRAMRRDVDHAIAQNLTIVRATLRRKAAGMAMAYVDPQYGEE